MKSNLFEHKPLQYDITCKKNLVLQLHEEGEIIELLKYAASLYLPEAQRIAVINYLDSGNKCSRNTPANRLSSRKNQYHRTQLGLKNCFAKIPMLLAQKKDRCLLEAFLSCSIGLLEPYSADVLSKMYYFVEASKETIEKTSNENFEWLWQEASFALINHYSFAKADRYNVTDENGIRSKAIAAYLLMTFATLVLQDQILPQHRSFFRQLKNAGLITNKCFEWAAQAVTSSTNNGHLVDLVKNPEYKSPIIVFQLSSIYGSFQHDPNRILGSNNSYIDYYLSNRLNLEKPLEAYIRTKPSLVNQMSLPDVLILETLISEVIFNPAIPAYNNPSALKKFFFSLRQVREKFYHAGLSRKHDQLMNHLYKAGNISANANRYASF